MAANVSSPRPTSDDSHSNRAKVSHGVNAIRKSLDALYEDMEKRPRVWRRALGLFLLGVVIIFWTVSGFLTSSVFANESYSKPYFVTWINTSFFTLPLIPIYLKHVLTTKDHAKSHSRHSSAGATQNDSRTALLSPEASPTSPKASASFGCVDGAGPGHSRRHTKGFSSKLSVRETFWASARFCGLWFFSNWMNTGSYENTSVASSTILVSTSSVFALLFGALMKVEKLTSKKVIGVFASLAGVVLVSLVDTTKNNDDKDRGSFPYKTPTQIAVGDGMALLSAILYGLYATILTRNIGGEDRVNMPLFFGFIGLVALLVLWPGIAIVHLLNIEHFALPPNRKIFLVILLNAIVSLVSDLCWGMAVLLLSPVVVTVGLTLTIPLSLVGQIFLNSQYSSPIYWLGAIIIVLSFLFITHESKREQSTASND